MSEKIEEAGKSDGGRMRRKVRVGVIVSDKPDKTVIVQVENQARI